MTDTPEATTVPFYYDSVEAFTNEFLANVFERKIHKNINAWCPEWWKHPEAVYRLTALWQSWEHLRINAGLLGSAQWLVQYADPIMSVVLDADGPFYNCREEGHRSRDPHEDGKLPIIPAPPGLLAPRPA